MGRQEVVVRLQPNITEEEVIKEIRTRKMDKFIDLLGYYTYQNNKYYLVFATDRHPGADFLVANYNAIPMEKVYSEFERLFVYKPI